MGNSLRRLGLCLAGDPGEISRRRNDVSSVGMPELPDEGLGHSFCYIPPEKSANKPETPAAAHQTALFRTISGAVISANTLTPQSREAFSEPLEKGAVFESSSLFSSIPLQPIPRNSVNSGPILRSSAPGSELIDRGFLSGPIERSFLSAPLDNRAYHSYIPKSTKRALLNSFEGKSVWSLGWNQREKSSYLVSGGNSGTSSTMTSSNLSSEMSFVNENDDSSGNGSLGTQNLQWAQGKAGEDRVHIVVSEDERWVFVGVYDGFNGPDATDFLLNNLYSNVYKELNGLLWRESSENGGKSRSFGGEAQDLPVDHLGVLKALSKALRITEESYLEMADMMLTEYPELALMGSCVLVMLMKDSDVYIMNVGDSRAVLARKCDSDLWNRRSKNHYDGSVNDHAENVHTLSSSQLTMDHSTCVKEELRRIRNAHLDDAFAVSNGRVKGTLKVTRAFGAGFLKHPKWNNSLLEMFRVDYIGTSPYITCSPSLIHHKLKPEDKFIILCSDGAYEYISNQEAVSEVEMFISMFPDCDPAQHLVEEVLLRAAKKAGIDFHELLDIPQGERRRYHDDVSIIIISFEGRIWRSSF